MGVNSRSGIIERIELLSPDAKPERINGRSTQVEKLQHCLRPMQNGSTPLSAWLYGPPGTGKTLIARRVAEKASISPYRISLYVNCWQKPTLYSVVQAMCEQLNILGAEARDTNTKLCRLGQFLKDKATLVILDDIDRPTPKERESIIYQLLQLPKTGLVCMSSDAAAFFDLQPGVRSRLSPVRMHLSKYSTDELRDILAGRASSALAPNTCAEDILEEVASLAGGDARIALHILLRSAVAAEKDGADRISTRHIPSDVSAWQRLEKISRIQRLPQHQQLIYKLAKEHGPLSSTRLRRIYLINCYGRSIEPMATRTFSKSVAQLAQHNLVSIEPRMIGGPGRLIEAVV